MTPIPAHCITRLNSSERNLWVQGIRRALRNHPDNGSTLVKENRWACLSIKEGRVTQVELRWGIRFTCVNARLNWGNAPGVLSSVAYARTFPPHRRTFIIDLWKYWEQ